MNVNWILSGNDIVNNQVLLSEIDRHGDKYTIIKPFGELPELDGPVISLVPLDMCVRVLRTKLYPGVYCNLQNLKCSAYYPHFQEYLLNNRFFFLPLANISAMKEDIFDSWLGASYEDLFVRPDSGFKSFTGQLVSKTKLDYDIKNLANIAISGTEFCLIAPPVNILREWRFVIGRRKIIACSQYRDHKLTPSGIPNPIRELSAGAPKEVCDFVENVLSSVDWEPEPIYTMDIAETSTKNLKVVELNCFSAAGLYKCDISKIVSEVRVIVIDEYYDYLN